jgi:hypothetical protein
LQFISLCIIQKEKIISLISMKKYICNLFQ